MNLNLANRLTLLRLVLIPFFLVFTVEDRFETRVAALIIFIIASLTDFWDGQIARARGQVTKLGIFLDPLADKFLISAAFVAFVQLDEIHVPAWMVVLIIGREFLITGLRTLAASAGRILPASRAGKFKTTSQIFAIITILVILTVNSAFIKYLGIPASRLLADQGAWNALGWFLHGGPYWLTFFTTVLTIVSGIIYLRDHADLLNDGPQRS